MARKVATSARTGRRRRDWQPPWQRGSTERLVNRSEPFAGHGITLDQGVQPVW